jgi:hypothetical protein
MPATSTEDTINLWDPENWDILDDLYEERAAIFEYEAGYSFYEANNMSAQSLGFNNSSEFKSFIQAQKAKVAKNEQGPTENRNGA